MASVFCEKILPGFLVSFLKKFISFDGRLTFDKIRFVKKNALQGVPLKFSKLENDECLRAPCHHIQARDTCPLNPDLRGVFIPSPYPWTVS